MATPPVLSNYAAHDALIGRLRDLQSALEAEGVRHASIFGSITRGDDVPKSDIDIILDLDPIDISAYLHLWASPNFENRDLAGASTSGRCAASVAAAITIFSTKWWELLLNPIASDAFVEDV